MVDFSIPVCYTLSIVDFVDISVNKIQNITAGLGCVGLEVGVLGESVYEYLRPETLRALHFYMGVGGADRFLSYIPLEQWIEADNLAAAHVQQFCKCEGNGCMACGLMSSDGNTHTAEARHNAEKIEADDCPSSD